MSGDQIYNLIKLGMFLAFALFILLGFFYLGTRGSQKTRNDEKEKSD